jgi:hypothetical protein
MDEACQKYPDSFKFPIALGFANVAFGQLHNGISQITSISKNTLMPKIYLDVLEHTMSNWVASLPIIAKFSGTSFEMRYVPEERNISESFDAFPRPCWLKLFSEAYIGSHVCQRLMYVRGFKKREK